MECLKNYSEDIENIFLFDKVISIILFGSCAKKQSNHFSDIDICILTKKNISMEEKNKILYFKDDILDISFFDELPLSFQYKVMVEGIIIKSKKDLTNLKINTINNWRDFRPILNRIYKSKDLLPIIE